MAIKATTKIILTAILAFAFCTTYAADKVTAKGESAEAKLSLESNPQLKIGEEEITFTDGKSTVKFSKEERIVLYTKEPKSDPVQPTVKGDVNGDGKVTMADANEVVNIYLGK